MLGQLERDGAFVISDLEAGVGTLTRLPRGGADLVLVVAEPTAKAIDVARRAHALASEKAETLIVANRVRTDADVEAIRAGVAGKGLVVVPEDPEIQRAEERGVAPIDTVPEAPAIKALLALAERLAASGTRLSGGR